MKRLGDTVRKGEPLYKIYAEFQSDLLFAKHLCESGNGFTMGDATEIPHSYLEF